MKTVKDQPLGLPGVAISRGGLIHQIRLVSVVSSEIGQGSQKLAACRLMEEAE